MSHADHWFKCAHCGHVGPESELPQDALHECGKDECPQCGAPWGITCCYPTAEAAQAGEPLSARNS